MNYGKQQIKRFTFKYGDGAKVVFRNLDLRDTSEKLFAGPCRGDRYIQSITDLRIFTIALHMSSECYPEDSLYYLLYA